MELRTLQYFLAVAREQNMTGAANIAVTVSCLAAWKKYQFLSPTCEAFLKGQKEEIHLHGAAETRDFSHERSRTSPPFNNK